MQQSDNPTAAAAIKGPLFFPADVVGIIATFLPPTTKVQQPLMLVNHTWLQGVACQDGASHKPDIRWPLPALRERDPAVLTLGWDGTDDDIVQLVKEMPRVKGIHLDQADISDAVGLPHIGKLKLLTSLKIHFKSRHMMMTNTGPRPMSIYPPVSNDGMKHLGNLRHLESLWLRNSGEITELPVEHLENLTSLYTEDCDKMEDAILAPAAKLPHLSTLLLCDTEVTDSGAAHLRTMKNLTVLHLGGCSSSSPLMEVVGELTNLTELQVPADAGRDPDGEGWLHLAKLKHLKTLNAYDANDEDLALITDNASSLTSLNFGNSDEVSADGVAELKKLKKNLKSLSLAYCENVEDDHLEHIGELVNLTELNLDECFEITTDGISHLANLKHLTELHLHTVEVLEDDIEMFVNSFPNLTYLDLGKTGLRNNSVELLKTMPHLKQVDLYQV